MVKQSIGSIEWKHCAKRRSDHIGWMNYTFWNCNSPKTFKCRQCAVESSALTWISWNSVSINNDMLMAPVHDVPQFFHSENKGRICAYILRLSGRGIFAWIKHLLLTNLHSNEARTITADSLVIWIIISSKWVVLLPLKRAINLVGKENEREIYSYLKEYMLLFLRIIVDRYVERNVK